MMRALFPLAALAFAAAGCTPYPDIAPPSAEAAEPGFPALLPFDTLLASIPEADDTASGASGRGGAALATEARILQARAGALPTDDSAALRARVAALEARAAALKAQ